MCDVNQHGVDEIHETFGLIKKTVSLLISHLGEMEYTGSNLFYVNMNDVVSEKDKDNKSKLLYIPSERFNPESQGVMLERLDSILKPAYRSEGADKTVRLVGWVRFEGTEAQQKEALSLINKLNDLKGRWGDLLKENFPEMKHRRAFLKKAYNGLIPSSVRRKLSDWGSHAVSAKLSWSTKGGKSCFVAKSDLEEVIARSMPGLSKEELHAKYMEALRKTSDSSRRGLVQRVNVRTHVIQTLRTESELVSTKRLPTKATLPLILLGNKTIKDNDLPSFKCTDKPKKGGQPRHSYHPVLPSIGLFERELTEQEYLEFSNPQN
ncbi:hypothetical protein TUMSATVNIG1_60300 (plasmid) [Vibrio nigripulchritudo]|uniref:DNA replication terminus site-binding protein n=1 Tax=Vibrio nigripulchritudo TaxID=28173 RepID=UPI00190AD86C|nr:DNA replication terminus site-binding protein [Vibrio nigripulchritudo]BCL74044.1 hypothetical protein VNTUMSATTG_59810 [Vibrio nigripulchritudo]BDU35421.1 hypothetical protein TUMSATVNIG1_60300 [Vibrio nigripulchritudo]